MSDSKDEKIREGHLGNLTNEQKQALETLKRKFDKEAKAHAQKLQASDCKDTLVFDDYMFLRRLRARDFKVDDAEESLRNTLKFRAEYKVDEILKMPTHVRRTKAIINKVFSYENTIDKDGRPLYMELTGALNKGVIYNFARPEDFKLCHTYDMELSWQDAINESKKRGGRPIETTSVIMDLEGLALEHKNFLGHLKAIADIDEAHYPETLHKIYLLNCPAVFPVIWALIKLFLDPVVVSKVVMLRGQAQYKPILIREVFGSAANLPVKWGGEKKTFTPILEEKKAVQALTKQLESLNLTSQTIAAGSRQTAEIDCKAGQTVCWYLGLESQNLNYSVRFEPVGGGLQVLFPETKISAGPNWGMFTPEAKSSGKLVISMDNSFSWMRSKTVKYVLRTRPFDGSQGDVVGKFRPYVWFDFE